MTDSAHLDERRLALQADARRFAMEELLPIANRLDPLREDLPRALLERLAARGYLGIRVPAQHGGMGLGVFEYCLITEELARAWMSAASIIARANGMGCDVADPARRARLLRDSAEGRRIGAAAFSEPDAGSDLAAVSCVAERDGDDWVIRGEKRWCGNAKAADFILLLARTSAPADGARWRGLELFAIEKQRDAFPPGLTGEPIPKIGYHGITSWNLTFDGLRVPADARLRSREGEGFKETVATLNVARVHTAARAVGLARGALEDALAYARGREQFGRPVSSFQAIRFKLADMATRIEAARQLYRHAADLIDRGARADQEAAMAKLFASEMAEQVTSEALQIHGGNGYTTEHAVERHWRDARLTTLFEGTSEIQRQLLSDRLLGDRA
jgi:alkylation response protein AidB-like acyl-CoA dehydrogenase